MPTDKATADKILSKLDSTANTIDSLVKAGKVDRKLASEIIREIDSFSDRFQVSVYGEKNLELHQKKLSKVIKKDSDEKYMDTFDNVNKPIKVDADEPYMHSSGPSFNDKKRDTFDSDMSSSVTNREKPKTNELNQFASSKVSSKGWAPSKVSSKGWAP